MTIGPDLSETSRTAQNRLQHRTTTAWDEQGKRGTAYTQKLGDVPVFPAGLVGRGVPLRSEPTTGVATPHQATRCQSKMSTQAQDLRRGQEASPIP